MSDTGDTTPVIQTEQDMGTTQLPGGTPPIPTTSGTDYRYTPPPRAAYVDGVYNPSYAGQGIVDKNNRLVVGPNNQPYYYNLNNDPTVEFTQMSEQKRENIAQRLDARGFSTETAPRFIASLEYLMEFGNNIGRDWETALNVIERITPMEEQKVYAPRYRVTSPDDLRSVADQVAQRTLGRKFTSQELNQFVQSYQQQELTYQQQMEGSGVVTTAPTVSTAAETFAERVAPTEANAYKFLGFFDQLAGSLRSRI